MVYFAVEKFLSLIRSHLFIFAFVPIALGDRSKKILLQFRSKSVLPVFSYRSFMVSGLTFKSLIHFEFIFIFGVRECSNFILLHVAVQFSQHHFFFLILFIYLFMAVLGLHFCARAFSSCHERGPLFIAVHRSLTIAASPVVEHRLQTCRLSNCGSRA